MDPFPRFFGYEYILITICRNLPFGGRARRDSGCVFIRILVLLVFVDVKSNRQVHRVVK